MAEPGKRALREASQWVGDHQPGCRYLENGESHRPWVCDCSHAQRQKDAALALDRWRREAFEEALDVISEEGWLGESYQRIRALIDREPSDG